ncbi:anti-repressor SinI family protein [Aneurinibacillus sp. Ricciae_BoGa-3]|uniref:anti-repressor SinI family protein n=1 Tax=Aneurinibacillus sp. Ricciae_BoGa-3 TaxID=3022697 RepID=UPI002341F743|nr:anti-repressor SinI family protein [Aneurinibacillus sp. Ricciae_BoGa-3]WCK54263.1 anti-repressor SinI family protein [Aneurinibacillus sp. Ricciae_BoGa-3]
MCFLLKPYTNEEEQEWVELIMEARRIGLSVGEIRLFLTNTIQLKQNLGLCEKILYFEEENNIDERLRKVLMLRRYNAMLK